jgi:Ca-activated chloride channel family protein
MNEQSPDVIVTPLRHGLLAGSDNYLNLLIQVQAPDTPDAATHTQRPALNLALVIDRSGSMSGRPLHEAKRCAGFMVDHLTPSDRLALVIYDDRIELLVPSIRVVDKRRFHDALTGVESRGSTNLHGGWLKGAEQVAAHLGPNSIARVLLLSDGCANQGMTSIETIASQCEQLAREGVSTSTYGLGNLFNEELMAAMARSGCGKPYYGDTAEDLMDPFREEFAFLTSLWARDLRLFVRLSFSGRVRVLNRFPSHPRGGCRMPDLAYGGEAWAVAQIKVPAAVTATSIEAMAVASFEIEYSDNQRERHEVMVPALCLPVLSEKDYEALAENELVARRLVELEAADLQESARHAAQHDDWTEVQRVLVRVRELAQTNEWLAKVVVELEGLAAQQDRERFSKETHYQALRMRERLAPKNEAAEPAPAGAPLTPYLRRKARVGKQEQ